MFLSLRLIVEARKLVEAPTPTPGISYANITQSSMKTVTVVDIATQTDPITIIDSAVQSSLTNTNSQTEELQRQKVQTNNATRSQTKTPIEEKKTEVGLKKATIEMIKKRFEETTTERKTSKKSFITI